MKFSIEKMSIAPNTQEKKDSESIETLIGPEIIEKNITRFCKEVLVKDQEVGFGNYSNVYQDTRDNGLCYKKYKPGAEKRMNITASTEMGFMEKVYGLDSDVKTPYPLGLAEVVLKNQETGAMSLVKVLAMEHFANSTRLEDVLSPKSKDLKKDFPESFDPQVFFFKLTNFVHKMHNELSIYHRDLFSRNVLIDNETGDPILIDFGDAAMPPTDERFNAYGDPTYGIEREDKDIKNIEKMYAEAIQVIDKNKINNTINNK